MQVVVVAPPQAPLQVDSSWADLCCEGELDEVEVLPDRPSSPVRHVTFEASEASQAQPQATEDIEEMSKSQRKRRNKKVNEQRAQLAAAAPSAHAVRKAHVRAASMPAKDKALVYRSYRELSHVLTGIKKLGYLHNRKHQLENTLEKMDPLGLLKPVKWDKSDETPSDAWLAKVMNFPPLDSTHKTARGRNRPRDRGEATPERRPNKGSLRSGRSRVKPSPRSLPDKRSHSESRTPTERTPDRQAPAARRQPTATVSVPPASPEGAVGGVPYSGILRNPPSPKRLCPSPTGGCRIPIPEGFASLLGMKPLCKCPLCPSSFTVESLKAHMESIHFPWFLNPFMACWVCHSHVTNPADQNGHAAHGGQFRRDTHLDYWGYLLVWFLNQLSQEL